MNPVAEMPGKEPEYGYIVSHQEVKLEVDFATQSLKGWTQLTILPLTRDLKEIRIDARQCSIGDGDVQVNRKNAMFEYDDPMELMDVPDSWDWSVHQHKLMQERIEPLVKPTRADGALIITIPRAVRVEEVNPMSVNAASEVTMRAADASAARGASVAFDGTGTSLPAGVPFTAKTAAEQAGRFNPLKVGISFTTKRFRDGLHFVGLGEGDMRYPHVYSKHSMDAGTASCIFPCVDDPAMRCTWEISIKCSRTLGDALRRQPVVRDHRNLQHLLHKKGLTNGVPPPLPEEYEVPLSDEDKLLEMAIICSGSLITETIDSEDGSKKVASFVVNQDMAPQHIGLAIGPFEQIDLSEFREEKDDEKLGQGQTLPVSGYCLPGRGDEVRHTCAPLAHALDYFLLQYGTFPSDECRFVFVDDQVHDVEHTASLSICSTRLLYGEDIIDPEIENLRILVHAIASQWMGVAVVAEKPGDRWVTVGLSHWMTDLFMKTICGHNDYLFRQKMLTDKLVKLDVTRPALTELGKYLHVGEFEHDFMKLKAPLVMFILDKRCVKASGSVGLSRVLSRIIVIANTGGPSDSVVSSDSFKKLAEKVTRYRQMDAFWAQWVNGAGCPKLNISQKFNKKRLCVEVTITQKHEPINSLDVPKLKPLEKFSFQREFKEEVEVVYAGDLQAYFTGPMTIRIHEADGTPYEHIVDIKEGNCKIEIPYNTKYKRLKRRNLQKARQAAGGAAQNGDANDEALYYCLGDVLQTDDEMRDWGLSKWEEATEKMMEGEFYEWIRVDADFEWLCEKTFVNMPAYMYVSQLQQDRDVVAQQEAIVYLKGAPPHPLPSTFLLRTVMDYRYFHGIRELAAEALVTHAVPVTSYTGLRHLEKAYQTLFCYVDTKMPKSNDFSDKRVYKLEMAMVRSFANMRDPDGRCPQDARVWLLDILRFNDNTNNEIVDYFKIANLLSALTDSIIQKVDKTNLLQDGVDEAKEWEYDQFKGSVIDALDRYRRMDEWINSYQNIFTVTVLDCKQRLMKANVIPHDPKEFAQYLHDGTSDYVRIKAFEALVELGLMNVPSVATFLLDSMSSDPSPFMRDRLLQIFFVGLAIYAFGENKTKEKRSRPAIKAPVTNRNLLNGDVDVLMGGVSNGVMPLAESNGDGGLLIDEDVNLEGRKADIDRTTTIDGAIAALKLELKDNVELKDALWNAIKSQVIEPHEQVDLLEVCGQIYEAVDSMIVKLPKPRFWKVEYLGKVCVFLMFDHLQNVNLSRVSCTSPRATSSGRSHSGLSLHLPYPRSLYSSLTSTLLNVISSYYKL